MNDTELIGMIGALHVVALAAGALLVLALARPDDERHCGPADDGSATGGDGPRRPAPPPIGHPLPDADQARVRLRQPGRLADRQPSRRRHRPARRSPALVREQERRD